MTHSVKERTVVPTEDFPTGTLARVLEERGNETGAVPIVPDDAAELREYDDMYYLQILTLPPRKEEPQHDLLAEAKAVVDEVAGQGDSLLDVSVTTPLSVSDANFALRSLTHPFAAMRLKRDHGEETHDRIVKKAKNIAEVNVVNGLPVVQEALVEYDHLRAGQPQGESYEPLKIGDAGIEDMIHAPLNEIGPDSIAFTIDEFRMVLEAARIMALIPTHHQFEDVEAWDFLARSSPAHSEQAYYRAKAERAGVIDERIAHAPNYNAGFPPELQ